jgi:hypothetical protein
VHAAIERHESAVIGHLLRGAGRRDHRLPFQIATSGRPDWGRFAPMTKVEPTAMHAARPVHATANSPPLIA